MNEKKNVEITEQLYDHFQHPEKTSPVEARKHTLSFLSFSCTTDLTMLREV